MESQPEKGSIGVAMLSGALVLLTGPLALALLIALAHGGEESSFGALAELWNESGVSGYAVLAAAALASLGGAVLIGLAVRRPTLGLTGLALFVLPMLAAVVGTSLEITNILEAIAHASPLDQRTILMAATGEVMSLQLQALAFCTAACLSIAAASFIGVLTVGRGPRVVAGLGSGLLALSLGTTLFQSAELRGALKAIAHANPADRSTILVGTLMELGPYGTVANAFLLGVLIVAIVGVAVLARGASRVPAIAVAATLLASAVGFRGFSAAIDRQITAGVGTLPPPKIPALVPFSVGGVQHTGEVVTLAGANIDEVVNRGIERDWEQTAWVALTLEQAAKRNEVLRALQVAHFARSNVDLVGAAPQKKLDVPGRYAALAELMRATTFALTVEVLFIDEVCSKCEATAVSKGEALEVTSKDGKTESWSGEGELAWDVSQMPRVDFIWNGDLPELARAARLALEHHHVLAIRVPVPDPEPKLTEENP